MTLAIALGVALLTAGVYAPAISPYLAFDDHAHIAPLPRLLAEITPASLWEAVWSSNSGPTGRPLAMATFVGQVALLGASAPQLKLVNVLLHLAVGVALYALGAALLAAARGEAGPSWTTRAVAAAAAAFWLLHPLNLSSVAYVIQRMNVLAALATVAALLVYTRWRRAPAGSREGLHTALAVGGLGAAGVLSKENAALLPVYLVVLEASIFRPRLPRWLAGSRRRRWLAGATVALAVAGLAALAAWWAAPGYDDRSFTMLERLLTQARVVVWYLSLLFYPDPGRMSLYHDGWAVSSSLLAPPTTLLALFTLGALLVAAWLARRRWPLFTFAVAWFLGGHLLESTVLPLELVFEHRNYLPSFGPVLWATAALAALARRLPRPRAMAAGGAVAVVLALAVLTHTRAERWGADPQPRLEHLLARPASVRAAIKAAQTYSQLAAEAASAERREALFEQARARFTAAAEHEPESADALFGWVLLYFEHGRTPPETLLAELERRLATGPVDATTVNGVHALTQCAVGGRCARLGARLPGLLERLLDNTEVRGGFRNRLLRDLARCRYHLEHRPDAALAALKAAVRAAPRDLDTRIELAYFEALASNRTAALAALERVQELDALGRKMYTTQRLRTAILTGRLQQPAAGDRSSLGP